MKQNPATHLLCILLLFANVLNAQNFHLLKDINKNTGSSPMNVGANTPPYYITSSGYDIDNEILYALNSGINWQMLPSYACIGDTVLFSISNGASVRNNLWRSNGTNTGTNIFVYLYGDITELQAVNHVAYYTETYENKIKLTNGTEAGTVTLDSNISSKPAVNGNSIFYIKNNVTPNKFDLWKYSTDTKGKSLLQQFTMCNCLYDHPLYKGGNFLYVYVRETDTTYSFWKSDGNIAYKLVNNNTGHLYSPVFTENKLFSKTVDLVGGTYYSDLNFFDSASNSFRFIAHLEKGSNYASAIKYAYKNDVLYFAGYDDSHRYGLWKTDGTEAGTSMIVDLLNDETSLPVSYMIASGNDIFYTALNENGGYDLWVTDGTGTKMLRSFGTDTKATIFYPKDINGTLYFSAYTNEYGYEPWKSDGTAEGTVMVKDLFPGVSGSTPYSFTPFKDSVLFSANDGVHGQELFISNGTASGTRLFQDVNTTVTENGIDGEAPFVFKNKLFFFANDGEHGNELWQSDGTEAGTALVKDLQSGTLSINPGLSGYLTSSGDNLYFGSNNNYPGINYTWKTNGIVGNGDTVTFKTNTGEIRNLNYLSYLEAFGPNTASCADVNGRLAFTYGDSLFITNQNQDSAFIVPLSSTHSLPAFSRGDTLIFYNADYYGSGGDSNDSIYACNAASKISTPIGHLNGTGDEGTFISAPLKDDNTTYFTAVSFNSDEGGSSTLMRTNGTEAGTADLQTAGYAGCIKDGIVYFSGSSHTSLDFDDEFELYKTDGTKAGTSMIKDINTDNSDIDGGSSKPHSFIVYKDSVYFLATDSTALVGLWVTDGTRENTHLISYTDLSSYVPNSSVGVVNGLMVFNTQDGKLLQSDGTPEGTLLVPDEAFKHITLKAGFTIFNDHIFAPAFDSLTGLEMWVGQLKQIPKPNLLSFTGRQEGVDAKLEWHVKNDSIIEHYELERSLDSIEFTSINSTQSKRNAGTTVYPATDANVLAFDKDTVYYRLKEFLDGGTIRYSNVIALPLGIIIDSGGIVDDNSIMLSPNPFGSQLRIVVKMTEAASAMIMVADASGKKLIAEKRSLPAGATTLTYNTDTWGTGVYFLTVVLDNGVKLQRKILK